MAPNRSFTDADFRQTLARFATGITVVTTRGGNGAPVGVTINSFTSVSLKPPLVLFCLGNKAGSLKAFRKADVFAVNILGASQESVSRHFAGRRDGSWSEIDWEWGDHGAPLIKGCLGWLVCKKTEIMKGGDHAIIMGKVSDIATGKNGKPLLYYGSAYRHLKS